MRRRNPRSPLFPYTTLFRSERAREAAEGQDVRIGGGATVIRDFLAAGLVDHMHIVLVPILLGRGVRLWDGLEGLEKRSEEHTSELQSQFHLVCRLLLEKKKH